MDPRLRKKHAELVAELQRHSVPEPRALEPYFDTRFKTSVSYRVTYHSGQKETATSAVGVLRSCAKEANIFELLDTFSRGYMRRAALEASAELEAAAGALAPATPLHGTTPLPALRVTRSADKHQDAADGALTPGPHTSGASNARSRRAGAEPRTAACSTQQHEAEPCARAESKDASSLVDELDDTLAGWSAAEAEHDAMTKSVQRKYDKALKKFSAQKARGESSAAGSIVDSLNSARQTAVAKCQQEEEARIAPALQQLQQRIDAAQARVSELDAAIDACPQARMLLMARSRPGRVPRLLRWLRACLMSLGLAAAVLVAVLLYSFVALRWVGSAAAKVVVMLVCVSRSIIRRLLSVVCVAAAYGPGQLAGMLGSLSAWLLSRIGQVQPPAWPAPGTAGVTAAAALDQAAAAGQRGRLSCSSRPLTAAQQPSFSRAAAANAGSVWAATQQLEGIVLAGRAYYQGQQAEPPSAAELVAVVVAVSRLVQAEFGAVQGRGECNLRDQVLRLLTGLLAVGGRQLIRSEARMGHGRSDLVLLSAAGGAPLLVVEYKLLPSEQGRHKQERNAAQLRRYLKDQVHGCREGLLITFDSALANGLSATRVAAVDRAAWAQLLGERPEHAPEFTSQPCHHLDKEPWAVGAMAGICQQYGIEVLETAGS